MRAFASAVGSIVSPAPPSIRTRLVAAAAIGALAGLGCSPGSTQGEPPDGGGGRDGGGGGAPPSTAPVRISAHAVDHCAVAAAPMPGRARVTPTGARAGVVAVELLRDRKDEAPVSLPLSASPLDVDLQAGAVLAAGGAPEGTYTHLRISLAYATLTFPATGHVPQYGALGGSLTLDLATATHTKDGKTRSTGELAATFTVLGQSSSFTSTVPNINCPLSDSGGVVDANGGKHTITVPMPGGPLVVVAGQPEQARDGAFPLAGAVTWVDLDHAGFAPGVYDIDGTFYANSEVPALLPMCNLLLTDRCEAGAEGPRHLPAWPMPDSSSATFSTGSAIVGQCPAAGQPGAGQDGCYTTHAPSYTTDEATVTDGVTGLVWQRVAPVETYDWWDARAYCASLELGGHTDWRLPSRLELESILDVGRADPAVDVAAFPDDRKDLFWTGSPVLFSSLAYGIRFDEGYVYDHDPHTTGAVRCVAGGAASPAQRFTLAAETALDNATGLMWQRVQTPAASWVDALAACEGSTVGGYTDWRVPSIKEYYTIVEDTAIAPCIDIGAFPDNTQEAYWTSTPGALEAANSAAWVVNFNDCYTTPAASTQMAPTRCVR